MFYSMSVIWVLVMVAVAFAVYRAHQRRVADQQAAAAIPPDLKPSEKLERTKRNVVVTAVAITTAILFVYLVSSYFVGRSLSAELAKKSGVAVEITGHQWWWEIRYPNEDASSYFTTANEIHIPTGVPVTFTLLGGDVIHSFWVPNLTGKKDLIPGKISTLWLQADRPGEYRGQCAEYCGLQHAHMGLRVIAEPFDQFDAWRRNQIQSAAQPSNETQQRGQQVFMTSTCVMCHTVNGTPAGSNIGPNLTHVASRRTIAADSLNNTPDHLLEWVKNSQLVKPGNRMPPNNLSDQDMQALLAYLENLK
jgi:cytochrome c oxidase subunit 2